MLEGWAEYYSVDLSEKIGRGLTENALKGKMNGGGLTFGYRVNNQRLEIDETTAPIVVEIFTRYADGEKMTDIAKDLTLRGVRTSKGNKITLNVVHYVLKNRRYIGEYKFRDMTIPDAIPPIVSEELFNRVQEIMARNQKAPAMHKAEDDYILTTKLFCGKCGTFMVGESGRSHTGTVHRYYKCSHAKRKKGCDKKPVKKDWIEDAVIHYIMKIVMDDELIDHIADAILNLLAQENSKLPQLNARLKEIENGIQNMLNAIQQGILTPSTKERLEALEQEKEELKVAIYSEELQKPKSNVMSMTVDMNVTNLIEYIHIHRLKFYPSMMWVIYETGTGFCLLKLLKLFEFHARFLTDRERYKTLRAFDLTNIPANTFDVSCLPWIKYKCFDIHVFDEGKYLAPVVTWGKYETENNKTILPLSMNIHHAVADGFHLCRFFNEVQEIINNL